MYAGHLPIARGRTYNFSSSGALVYAFSTADYFSAGDSSRAIALYQLKGFEAAAI
jgi:hypothetical protein